MSLIQSTYLNEIAAARFKMIQKESVAITNPEAATGGKAHYKI